METIYLHDAYSSHLIVRQLPTGFTEEDVEKLAADNDMRFNDVQWGTVSSLSIEY